MAVIAKATADDGEVDSRNDLTMLDLMREDVKRDAEMLSVKRRIIKALEKLPDDDARTKVIKAVGILYGVRE